MSKKCRLVEATALHSNSSVEFKFRKQKNSIMHKYKNLGNKSQELTNLKFSWRLFVSGSMSHENQQLAYKC